MTAEIAGGLEVTSGLHGETGSIINWQLAAYVYPRKLGRVFNSTTTFRVEGIPPKRQPDVSFVTLERMPTPIDDEVPFAPDFVVEIVSRNDTAYEIREKVAQYQKSGVRLIWVVYPVSKTVEIYHLDRGLLPQVLSVVDALVGEDVVPGFKLKVSDFFE